MSTARDGRSAWKRRSTVHSARIAHRFPGTSTAICCVMRNASGSTPGRTRKPNARSGTVSGKLSTTCNTLRRWGWTVRRPRRPGWIPAETPDGEQHDNVVFPGGQSRVHPTLPGFVAPVPRCSTGHEFSTTLTDHHGRGIGVAAGDVRDDRRICDTQAVDATYSQLWIDNGTLVRSHPAGTDRMVDTVDPIR